MKSFIRVISWIALVWSVLGVAFTISQPYGDSFYAIVFGLVIISQSICVLIQVDKDKL